MGDNEPIVEGMTFESILQAHVPKGRYGKHKGIVAQLLSDIAKLSPGAALKIPISQLPDTKQNVRSALSRAASQQKINLATSSNDEFLFVWKTDK
jgi:acyl CoA:acetate/3-ketoacid CoA transferase